MSGERTLRVGLIGFGTVGQGFARIVADHGAALAERYGVRIRIHAVVDPRFGGIAANAGFEPERLLDAAERGGFGELSADRTDLDARTAIREVDLDVVAELAPTDLATGEPGVTHVRDALTAGRHVITTNKGPVALRFPELLALAERNGVRIGVEGTVMSGTPTLGLATEQLAGAGTTGLTGILNGTTNYMLGRMEAGLSFDAALAEAQAEGYAEADPSGDVDGIDAAGKVVILANLALGEPLAMSDVERRGIRDLTPEDLRAAREAGETWKLVGRLNREPDGRVRASVRPTRLPNDHPLASVRGATNACTFHTELLGDVTIIGPGAGRLATGYALVHDLLAIDRTRGARA